MSTVIVVVGDTSGKGSIAYSSDASTWNTSTNAATIFPSSVFGIVYGNGVWVATSNASPYLAWSTDGNTWTAAASGTSSITNITGIAYGNGRFVAGGSGSTSQFVYSSDGKNWLTSNASSTFFGTGTVVYALTYGNGYFVAGATQGTFSNRLAYSTNGIDWTLSSATVFSGASSGVTGIAYGNSTWVAVGYGGNFVAYASHPPTGTWSGVSISGIGWTLGRSAAFGNSMFLIGGQGTAVMYSSTDGANWSSYGSTTKNFNFGLTNYNGTWYAAVGDTGGVQKTTNGTWSATTAPLMASARGISSLVPAPPPTILYANIYSNGSAIVSFSQEAAAPAITSYYYSTNGGSSFTNIVQTTSPIVITGLNVNASYALRLMASNTLGNSSPATVTVGNASVITRITPFASGLFVYFTPSSGGTPAATYYKYSIDGGQTFDNTIVATTSPLIIRNLQGNTSYSVSIQAGATNWVSANSSVSSAVETMPLSSALQFTYAPTVSNANVALYFTNPNVYVDWGDSTNSTYVSTGYAFRNYATAGTYAINVTGSLVGLGNANHPPQTYLTSVQSFGNLGITSLLGAFAGTTSRFTYVAQIPPTVTNLQSAFVSSGTIVSIAGLDLWDVSNVSIFNYMFTYCSVFNQDISNWNMRSATTFVAMFYRAFAFTVDIGKWNLSNGTNFQQILFENPLFDRNLGNWDIRKATNFVQTFYGVSMSTANNNATLIGWANLSLAPSVAINDFRFNITGILAIDAFIKLKSRITFGTNQSVDISSNLIVPTFNMTFFAPGYAQMSVNTNYNLMFGSNILATYFSGPTTYANSVCQFFNIPKIPGTNRTLFVRNANTVAQYGASISINMTTSITSVTPILGGITVNFTRATSTYDMFPVLGYYYSVDGGNTYINANSLTSPITISNLTEPRAYTVRLFAATVVGNTANVVSSSVTPFLPGTAPNIINVFSNANGISVSFYSSLGGNPSTAYYYYSVNGNAFANTGLTSNSLILIPNLTVAGNYTVQIMAVNSSGNVLSGYANGFPYVIGTAGPNITQVNSNVNSLTVSYTNSVDAYPTPYIYYLVNGTGVYANSGINATSGNITIPGLTVANVYTISLLAVNPAGNLLSSANATGTPYTIGTQPNIISVASVANGLSVSINASRGANPAPAYYYSVNGNVAANYLLANVVANSFVAGNLTLPNVYTVYLMTQNVAGNVYSSNTYSGSPFVLGSLEATYNVNNSNLALYFPFNNDYADYSTGSAVVPTKDANVSFIAGTGNTVPGGSGSVFFGASNTTGITTKNITSLGTNGLTVALWLKFPTGTIPAYTRFFMFNAGINPYFSMYALSNGAFGINFSGNNGLTSTYVISDSNWHHYCVVISAAGICDIYVDGINRGSRAVATATYPNDYTNFSNALGVYTIGGNDAYGAALTNAYMTQFLMLKRAITAQELSILINQPSSFTLSSSASGVRGPYPNIIAVSSNVASLTVRYTGVLNANPPPYYYYSVDGQAFANSGINANTGNITIPNITVAGDHTVQLMAVNPAGNVVSNQANGFPYFIGASPNIISVAPTANSITVSFQQSVGDPAPIYYYSLNGNVATSFANAFSNPNASINLITNTLVIGNLRTTTVYSVFLLAVNAAGNVYSNNAVSAQSGTLGTAPNITQIYSNLNSLIVQFRGTVGGNPAPFYYYSVNGQTAANSGLNTNVGNLVVPNLTVANVYTVQLIAVNPAGNLVSNSGNGQPYIVGSWPNINSVASIANGLSVSFQASTGGYPVPYYYYSLNGGTTYSNANIFNLTASSFTIGNLFVANTYSVLVGAISVAGNVYSAESVQRSPYTLGTSPNITNIYSNLNSLIVQFNASTGGYTDPYYYYSVNGNATYSNTGLNSNASNITILGFTQANVYSVRLLAVNPAGNIVSNSANGQPYILGSQPNINSVAPLANSLSVSFQASVGGYTAPTYYYSLDGGNTYSNANVYSQTANSLVVGNLYSATTYNVLMLAVNAAGNVYSSSTVPQMPYVLGNATPNITNVYSGINSLLVQFTGVVGANPAPYYYYSINGNTYANTNTTSSSANIVIPGFTKANTYTVSIMSVGPAGNMVSGNASGQPYILGSLPNIISVASVANALSVSFYSSDGGYDAPTYYYSLNGNVATAYVAANMNGNANSFVIGGLTAYTTSNISLLAQNAAGNVYSATTVQQTPYVVGNVAPTILSVISNINALSVRFTSALNANPAPYYYYSVDGSAFANSGQNSNNSLIYIPGITVLGNHTVQLLAVNPAGNVESNSANGQPFLLGSQPNIISVEPLANSLSVSFQASVGGYTAPTYYYSINGNSAGSYVAAANVSGNGFVISGLTAYAAANISLLAQNEAGNAYSATTVLQTPYVVGNVAPTILSVISNLNALSVQFTSALNANPAPYYYYSVDGSAFANSGQNSNNSLIYIPGVNVLGNHVVQLLAVGPAGNVASNSANGQPFLLGSQPNIISVAPLANALSVSFQASVGGYTAPTYYYSLNGNLEGSYVAAANVSGNGFVINGLTEYATSNISLLAQNAAGNVYSATTVQQMPYVVGNAGPSIFYVASGINSLTVAFASAQNANPAPYYYYSVDGSAFANSGQNSNISSIIISNVVSLGDHTVQLMAVNPAGNTFSGNAIGQSFIVGSQPNIISVVSAANALSVSFYSSVGGYPAPTYYYSISGNSATEYVAANMNGNANSFVISGLTAYETLNISLLAQNDAGNVYSATTVQQMPYVVGNAGPAIFEVQSNVNSLTVAFSAAQNANPPPYYYYSVDGSVFSNSGLNSNATAITIPGLTVAGNYSVQIMASNPAGNVITGNSYGSPFTAGTQPNIISVANLANSLAVSFQGVAGWNPQPTYYYSINGNSAGSYVVANVSGNSFLTANIYVANTYYVDVVAINVAGNAYSANIVAGNPYVLGSAVPSIANVISATNSLVVQFAGAVGANPAPYYYYSVDGSVFSNSGLNSNTSNIVIPNITVFGNYQVAIMSVSPAGNMVSGNAFGQPYVIGSWPNIISVENLANSLSVSFQGISGWNPQPTYYYSINGKSGSYVEANVSANSFIVSNIYVANTYYVDLVAINVAGNAYSANIVPGNPYVLGSAVPSITTVQSAVRSLVVQFAGTVGANPDPYYYYSVDGSVFSNSGLNSNTSNIVIPNITVFGNYRVSVMSVSPAGNMVSGNAYGQPFTVGSQPNIISVLNLANSLSVSFQGISGWNPPPTYYYSINGKSGSYVEANVSGNGFLISNIYVANTYYVDLVAINVAGNSYSVNIVPGTPYVLGTATPTITSIQSLANSLVVQFGGAVGAFPEPYYYYSVDGSVFSNSGFNSNASNILISDLTVAGNYQVSVMSVSPAGNMVSANAFGQPYVLGTTPSITNIASNLRSLVISFSESVGAYPTPYYYYSVDGSAYSNSGFNGNASNIVISNLTVAKTYTISLLAPNPAGNLVSGNETGIPYILGSMPNINSVSSLANALSVSFQTSVDGYPAPTYYYSLNGNASGSYISSGLGPNANVLVVGNLYSAAVYGVSMLAVNSAGNVYSGETVSGEPYVLGTTPSITNIASNLRSLILSFSASVGAYPAPYYYYSVDGSAYSNTGFNGNASNIVIPNLTVAKPYIISLLASNPAGNLISEVETGIPYILGSMPNINSVSSLANALSVSFQTSVDGYPAPTYYYSIDGGNTYVQSGLEPNANVLVIGNLYSAAVYNVSMLALNAAGNVYSGETVSGEPYVLGTTPSITNIQSNLNSLILSFSRSEGAYPAPYYYYSVDGSAYSNTGFNGNASNIIVANLTVAKSYAFSLLAANPAGNLISGNETGIPYIVGTPPVIANVISLTNGLLINFSGSIAGYPDPTTYYYTLNGGNTFIDSGSTVSPITVGNLATGTYSVGLFAKNVAGNTAISNIVSGQPYIIGTAPVITDVISQINSLEVRFTGPVGAVPDPYTYTYSLNGVDYVDSSSATSPIIIGNLTMATSYGVSIKAVSLAGTTAASNTIFQRPYVIGVPPVINVDGSLNKLIINWTDISGGYPAPYTFLYSLDGINYVDVSSNANPIIVSGLMTPTPQYVSLKAVNAVGTSGPSNTVIATPWIIGGSPHINSLTTAVNGFVIDFSGSMGGYPSPTTYLYSVDGGVNYLDSFSATSPLAISGLSPIQQYTVCIKAVNAAGVSPPSNSITESPFLIVDAPTINSAVLVGNSTLAVSFTSSPGSYLNPFVYLYSVNGSQFMGSECVESPLLIPNYAELTRPVGRSMGMVNTITLRGALEVTNFSAPIPPQYPLVIGSPPEITAVSSVLDGLSITFSGPVGGYPAPTTYYYSLDGGDYLNSGTASSPIVIGNLRGLRSYSVSLIAQNAGGNTTPSNTGYGSPYVIGTAPVILDVSGINNGLVINFTESTGFNPPPSTYLYSLDGVNYSDSGYTTSPITITNLSPVEIYRVSLKALNAGGLTAASNSVLATPYSTTNAPVITNATLVNSNLVISFNPVQSSVLYPTPIVYYYSLNGSGQFEGANYTSSPIVVNGVLERVQSVSIKGMIVITSFSIPYVGQPYIIGTPPTISSVQSIENGLVINFTAGINGYPEITDYYYSINNGNTYVHANTLVSPITITGFTKAIKCYVVMIARNLGGNTAPSNTVVQTPYINGTVPVITKVLSNVNSLIVEFTPSVDGSPEPVSYYYSIDGVHYIDSGYNTSPLVIPNLTTPYITYNVSIKTYNSLALGPASNVVSGRPYVAGYAPQIVGLESTFQEMSISFVDNGAYPVPTEYYYSVDGINYKLAAQKTSPVWVPGLLCGTRYDVYIYSVNIAGNSPPSAYWSYWTKYIGSFFKDTMNSTSNPNDLVCGGNKKDNSKLNSGANDTSLSTKQKYSKYVSGTGRTRR